MAKKAALAKASTKATGRKKPGASQLEQIKRVADLLKQASDPTRVRVLLLLSEGERHVGGLCEDMGLTSQPAVSHHLALLRHGGLVAPRRKGKHNFYALTEAGEGLARVVKGIIP
jgi:DNA-binding transcriptional ArsR family regulator